MAVVVPAVFPAEIDNVPLTASEDHRDEFVSSGTYTSNRIPFSVSFYECKLYSSRNRQLQKTQNWDDFEIDLYHLYCGHCLDDHHQDDV